MAVQISEDSEKTSISINRDWASDRLLLTRDSDRLYSRPPKLGIVIGTYAAVPHVHLQLESRRRFFPTIPLLVHDDGSPSTSELRQLCAAYGCDFETNACRLPPHLGDVSVFIGGLKWAEAKGIELLVKISRRWLFVVDWTASLLELAQHSQYATFSNYTKTHNFGFRTECIGISVKLWASPRFYRSAIETVRRGQELLVEAYMHQFAREHEARNCSDADDWRSRNPVPAEFAGYAAWPLMGTDRATSVPSGDYLWHESHSPRIYADLAAGWGLPYTEGHFASPNEAHEIAASARLT